MGRALEIVNDKLTDLEQAEAKALSDVKDYYGACMEALRVRMNGLGLFIFFLYQLTVSTCCIYIMNYVAQYK